MKFTNLLVFWYLHNKRDLPWRKTTNPYIIWLSEIILQQTRVDQGLPYFNLFIKAFPTVFDLAAANEEKVLKLWQGLGYYSRARNLHHTAKYIVEHHNGQFPLVAKELKELKGIGDYTAAAIASISYNEPIAVVDGNVYRVLSRVFGVFTPINSTQGIKEFKLLAQKLLDADQPGNHNQAVMELGARICKPKNPNCHDCPVNMLCTAREEDLISELPVKLNKLKVKKRYLNYLVILSPDNKTVLVKRTKGIWNGLYEFPVIEADKKLSLADLTKNNSFQEYLNEPSFKIKLFNTDEIVHKLSHQHLFTQFWLVEIPHANAHMIPWKLVENYPVSRLIDKFLKCYKNE